MNSFCAYEEPRNISAAHGLLNNAEYVARQANCNNVWQFLLPAGIGGLIALLGSLLTGNLQWAGAFPLAVLVACRLVRNSVLENKPAHIQREHTTWVHERRQTPRF